MGRKEARMAARQRRPHPGEPPDLFSGLTEEELREAAESLRAFLAILQEWDSRESDGDIKRH